MITALLVLAAVAVFVTFAVSLAMIGMTFTIARDLQAQLTLEKINTGRITILDGRLQAMDRLLTSMATVIAGIARRQTSDIMQALSGMDPYAAPGAPPAASPPALNEMYETEDGRHAAPTFRELMERVMQDPRYKVARPEDLSKLKDLFEQSTEPKPPRPASPHTPPLPESRALPSWGTREPTNRPPVEPPTPEPPYDPPELDVLDDPNNDEDDDGA